MRFDNSHPVSMLAAVLAAASFCVPGFSATGKAQSMPGMEHHDHEEAPASMEKLGQVHFPVSCAASSQAPFERGVALLHSFGYTVAEQQFRKIAAADPACAMAHWGIAMAQFHELWGRPEPDALKTGASEMATARRLAAASTSTTPRELAYLKSLSDFYADAPASYQRGADAYAVDMSALHAAYPNDVEGAAFYALSLLADRAPGDTSLTKEHEALAVLVPLFHKYPNHPGLAHYIIHTCDTPALAPQGLEAAEVYAKIAPSSPHALHMPGHIFARLGMWPEGIASNLASVAASEQDEREHLPGAAHQLHADEFLVYAWLQTGQDEKARALTDRYGALAVHLASLPGPDDMKYSGAGRDNRLRVIYAMEMHQWKALAAMQPDPDTATKGFSAFSIYWGQGVAAGHLHDPKLAAAALARYDEVLERLRKSPQADSAEDAQVERNEIIAWQAFALGNSGAALTAMRKAADQQDRLGQGEVDIPANEMLGDLLMMEHRPQEALVEYRVALRLSPNRLNGLLGAGEAAEALGHTAEAGTYYAQVARNTHNGVDTGRPAVAHAVEVSQAQSTVASIAASAGR
jgi:tetratricopeptide (TPR) repeat protein